MNFRKYLTILIVPLTFILFSCGNMFNSQSKNIDSAQTKAYFSVKVSKISSNRTINHDDMYESDSTLIQALEDFSLTGKYQNEDNDKELLTAQTAVQLAEKVIEIDAGNWEFTLSAKYKGLIYKATKTVTIEQGKNNTASFILKPEEDVGGYQISYTMTATPISMVKATLTKADGSGTPIIQTITADAFETEYASSRRYAVFKRDISNTAERMETGSYSMLVEFFADQNDVPVNTREDYLYIQAGRMTYAVIAVDFNEVFSIDYKDESGNLLSTDDFESGIIITKYSIRSEFNLPRPKASNKIFMGWKEMNDSGGLSSNYVEKVQKETKGNKVFVAIFKEPTLYVSGTGNDSNDGWTITTALKTVETACGKIVDLSETISTENYDWTIKIDGDVSGIPQGTSGDSSLYGTTIIPNTLTIDNAKSLLITGVTVHNEDPNNPQSTIYVPEDRINNHKVSGNAVIVETTVPVTFTNIMITGGRAIDGAGIKVVEGATVKLGDDAWIIGNSAASNGRGGGIHNEGTVFIYGTAVVGNRNATGYAVGDSSTSKVYDVDNYDTTQINGNYSTCGGGIYNGSDSNSSIIAKLYLGYCGFDENGEPVKEDLKAGFFANGASQGGAIYNAPNCQVYFDTGFIKYNAASDTDAGGGIFNKMGTVKMTGGKIINNRAYWPGYTSNSGGGIFNYNNSARFIMSGGLITDNYATANGGAICNGGKVFISGDAVIGNAAAESLATETTYGNKAIKGGAIYNDGQQYGGIDSNYRGELYIGYVPAADGVTPVKADYSGGIYQNYSTYDGSDSYGGGAIYSTAKIKISGGTIAWNFAKKNGGAIAYNHSNTTFFDIEGGSIVNNDTNGLGKAIYLPANSSTILSLSGDVLFHIKKNDDENDPEPTPTVQEIEQDIYIVSGKIELAGALDDDFKIKVTPSSYSTKTQILTLGTDAETSIGAECEKFNVVPQTVTTTVNGTDVTTTTKWYLDETGYLVKYNKPAPEFVGDIVLADGTAITGKYASKMSDSEKASAVAVIFYSGNTKGVLGARMLGVGLKRSDALVWAKSGTTGYNTSFEKIISSESFSETSDDKDGSDNWDEICAVDPEGTANAATNYPAFNWANNYGETVNIDSNNKYYSNWFIPTIAEATQLWNVHNDVNSIIQILGGDEVASNYSWWTSSQVAGTSNKSKAYARYSSNSPQTTDKIYPYNVHVIHEFGATVAPDPITISTNDYSGEIEVNYERTKNGSYYIYTFTVDTTDGEYDSYIWSVDGNEKSNATDYYSKTASLSIDSSVTAVWKRGIYDIMVIAKKGSRYYSWSTQLNITVQ